jgi:hypothetical protein
MNDNINYEELRAGLMNLPDTWYPDLIRALVEASYKKGVWKPNGCSTFVNGT